MMDNQRQADLLTIAGISFQESVAGQVELILLRECPVELTMQPARYQFFKLLAGMVYFNS